MVQLTGVQWSIVGSAMLMVALICAYYEWRIRQKERQRHLERQRDQLIEQAKRGSASPTSKSDSDSDLMSQTASISGAQVLKKKDKPSKTRRWLSRERPKSSAQLARERLISLGVGQPGRASAG